MQTFILRKDKVQTFVIRWFYQLPKAFSSLSHNEIKVIFQQRLSLYSYPTNKFWETILESF